MLTSMQACKEEKTSLWDVVCTSPMLDPGKVTVRLSAAAGEQVCKRIAAAAPVARIVLVALSKACCRSFCLQESDFLSLTGGVYLGWASSCFLLAVAATGRCFCHLLSAPKDLNKC
jgi:hypothetical protein